MQKRSEETRVRILQAAGRLFAGQGYDATGVVEICEAAGVSKGAFYHHFPTKQKLFLALLEAWLSGLDMHMNGLLTQAGDVPEGLITMTSITQDIFSTASGKLPIFLEFWRESSHDPLVWSTTIEPYRKYTELFAAIIRRGIQEGSVRDVNAQNAARVVVALALGLVLQGVMDPDGAPWNEVARDGMTMLMEGLSTT